MKRVAGYFLSLVSIAGINFIPLDLVMRGGFSPASAMIYYALENVVAILFAAAFVYFFAPSEEPNPDYARRDEILKTKPAFPVGLVRKKSEILSGYIVFSLGFSVSAGVFLVIFVFLILKARLSATDIMTSLWWILAFEVVHFVGSLIALRPLTLGRSERFLTAVMGRVALLFISVFIGIFVALFVDAWFVYPFVALKTLADIGYVAKIFRR